MYLSADTTSDVYLCVDDRYTPQRTPAQIRTIDLDGRTAYLADTGPATGTATGQPTSVLSWQRRLRAFKDNTILTLADPASTATLSVSLVPHPTYLDGLQQIRIGARRGEIIRTSDGWLLQVEPADGRAFQLQAPAQLNLDHVIAIAEQVSVRPE
ncbi:hypothetical protein [Winogradskya humida]|uniref:hypothetical protein n=1 Tax=Winogradskya humida TaxID=113566 RepID=UPI0019439F9E|nr:hypothetical protein [Actinoplanes humidus]